MKRAYQIPRLPLLVIGLATLMGIALSQEDKCMPQPGLGLECISQMVIHPKDIEASKAFYVDKLGFTVTYPFGGGPVKGYQLQSSGIAITLLSIQGAPTSKIEQFMLHIKVSDVDGCCKLLQERGVTITRKIEDTDWKSRWFHIEDPDGLTLAFEQRK